MPNSTKGAVLTEIEPYFPTLNMEASKIIVLQRYESLGDHGALFGIHIVCPLQGDDEGEDEWLHHTLNLFNEAQLHELMALLDEVYGSPVASTWSASAPSLAQFIHSRVIPLEWKLWTPAQYDRAMTVLDYPATTYVSVEVGA